MTEMITDPADQSSGWYIRQEEAIKQQQQALEKEFAGPTLRAAIAQVRLALSLLDSGYFDIRSCLIQAGITPTADKNLEYLRDQWKPFIPTPGWMACEELESQIHARVGRRVMGREKDFDWYQHIEKKDMWAVINIMERTLKEISDNLPHREPYQFKISTPHQPAPRPANAP